MTRIPTLLLILLVVAMVGCAETAENAEGATDAMKNLGEDAAKTADDMATAGSEMLEGAAEKIGHLSGDAKVMAEEYYGKIQDQEAKLKEVKTKLADMSPQDLLSDQGKNLKSESETITAELTTLKDKLKGILDQAAEH